MFFSKKLQKRKIFQNQGVERLRLVSGNGMELRTSCHGNGISKRQIRHVFGFTSLTDGIIRAGLPVVIQLSGFR